MNVFVEFDPWGRMGNRMFQYAFGYLLAQKRVQHFMLLNYPILINLTL